ncbi:hypothetical protein AMECASPLE_036122 [Ameca splendens]|uniref:Uncharacterized protein n=1 Tax=Ameca splendens TaxID=208324 RepID=A0ABV1A3A2_9TELE
MTYVGNYAVRLMIALRALFKRWPNNGKTTEQLQTYQVMIVHLNDRPGKKSNYLRSNQRSSGNSGGATEIHSSTISHILHKFSLYGRVDRIMPLLKRHKISQTSGRP